MAPSNTRQKKKLATREALKRAGREAFATTRYSQVKIAGIAKAAGVAPGTFYVHFKSKEALLDELLAEFNEELVAQLKPLWSSGLVALLAGGPTELVRSLGTACLDFWFERRGLLEAFIRRAASSDSIEPLRDGISPDVAGFLTAGLQTLAVRMGGPLDHVELVIQGMLGLWTRIGLQYVFNDAITRDQAIDTLTRMSVGAVAGVLPGLGSL